jgi:hypothetical protein
MLLRPDLKFSLLATIQQESHHPMDSGLSRTAKPEKISG